MNSIGISVAIVIRKMCFPSKSVTIIITSAVKIYEIFGKIELSVEIWILQSYANSDLLVNLTWKKKSHNIERVSTYHFHAIVKFKKRSPEEFM